MSSVKDILILSKGCSEEIISRIIDILDKENINNIRINKYEIDVPAAIPDDEFVNLLCEKLSLSDKVLKSIIGIHKKPNGSVNVCVRRK